ncbi:MAG: hydroxyacid dehydrogenase [Rhodospirillales bacterium]|jgi:D-3-phosphoglycerate dehydrogenase|nr:hydroxyacid dehydrogenase [Rhodospirillales bacterium]
MAICLLIQPIHEAGIGLLTEAGIEVRRASAFDMDTVATEIVDADAAITRNAGLNAKAMQAAAKLKVLGNHGIGVDPVDVGYATEIGLPIIFTPYANVQSVAEHTILQMLSLAKRVREADAAVRAGRYDFRYSGEFHELSGKMLAVIGFGRTGRYTARIAKGGFGMRVAAYDPYVEDSVLAEEGVERADDLAALLGQADVVSLHLQLTPETRGLMNRDRLALMKPGALLVNTSRGGLVDAEALVEAVTSERLAGAAMDVFEKEPPPADHPFCKVERILLSPHIAGATRECLQRTAMQTAAQVIEVLEGKRPAHLVNPTVWDRRRR